MIDRRLAACALASIAGHVVFARALAGLPPRELATRPRVSVEIHVVPPPPPPPEPSPPVEPVEPASAPPPRTAAPRRPVRPVTPATTTTSADAPAVAPSPIADPSARPVFGVSMESTSQAGSTAAPVGNTHQPSPSGGGGERGAALAAAAADEVTRMPIPRGRCAGAYTEAARAAGLEGTVVLDVVVDETGRTRDIRVVEGLGHGLTEAAVAALRACTFSPGEKASVKVPVRIRGFKIRFVLQDATR